MIVSFKLVRTISTPSLGNRSIHSLREQLKEVLDVKLPKMQKQLLKNLATGTISNNSGSKSPQKVFLRIVIL